MSQPTTTLAEIKTRLADFVNLLLKKEATCVYCGGALQPYPQKNEEGRDKSVKYHDVVVAVHQGCFEMLARDCSKV